MARIKYDYDAKGNVILPQGAPFDGKPILIKFPSGWCEAWWASSEASYTQEGIEYTGFCWICMDDCFQKELDDAMFWLPLPETP